MIHIHQIWSNVDECKTTKLLCLTLIIFYLIGLFLPSSVLVFALVPANTITVHYFVWNLFTGGLFETSFVMAIMNVIAVIIVCPGLERAWNSRLLVKFVVVVNILNSLSVFALSIFFFAVTQNDAYLFWEICGFSGLNAAFSVGLKQRFAEKPVTPFSFLSFYRVKHVPVCVLLLGWVLYFLGYVAVKEPILLFFRYFLWLALFTILHGG